MIKEKEITIIEKEFTIDEIRLQPATQIPLYTLIRIMNKSCTHDEMLWYINQTHKNGWSRSMVLNQFKLKAYECSLIEPETSPNIATSFINIKTEQLYLE